MQEETESETAKTRHGLHVAQGGHLSAADYAMLIPLVAAAIASVISAFYGVTVATKQEALTRKVEIVHDLANSAKESLEKQLSEARAALMEALTIINMRRDWEPPQPGAPVTPPARSLPEALGKSTQ